MKNLINSKKYFSQIQEKWKVLQNTDGVFAYNLNVSQRKFLPGVCKFYVELNAERTQLRRAPQQIASLTPSFDEQSFNFTKVQPLERIIDIATHEALVSVIINRSPLTPNHTLICPNLAAGQPQLITLYALQFCVDFLLELREPAMRIGYNSPGALASVNHLHLHLLQIDVDLYVDHADLTPLVFDFIYRLSEDLPTEAICFIISAEDSVETKANKLQIIYEFFHWLCAENLPHNIFMTASRCNASELKIFVYARAQHCIIKDVTAFNLGFCELSGYMPVGSPELYASLTEEKVIAKICADTGEVYSKIYSYLLNTNLKK